MQSAREITEPQGEDQAAGDAPRSAAVRAGLLFVDFFLIITAYYQLKPASRSLFIEYLGADRLPYVWIATAVVLGAAMVFYHHLVERHSRFGLVLGTSLTFAATLVGFRILLAEPGPAVASAFYVFVDIFSVVLVEQFWSLTNSLHTTEDGKRWYGLVGAGGLCGGVAGGGIAAAFLQFTPMPLQPYAIGAGLVPGNPHHWHGAARETKLISNTTTGIIYGTNPRTT